MNDRFYCSETARSEKCIKVLAVGNSFSQDSTTFLRHMALADGIDLRVGYLYIGGCSLERHYNNITNGKRDYDFRYYTPEYVYDVTPVDLDFGLEANDWDYVTMQQVSGLSGKYETFQPYATVLAAHIKEKVPAAKLLLHMTWGYLGGTIDLANFGYTSQTDMYEKIKQAYAVFSKETENAPIIPSGEAVQLARQTFMGDTFNRDALHLNDRGKIVSGYVWYEIFTGISPFESKYDPAQDCDLTPQEIETLKACAHKAVLNYEEK